MNIIFDLDGTLIDSFHRHYVVLYNALKYFDVSDIGWLDEQVFRFCKRNGKSTELYLRGHSGLEDSDIESLIDYWKSHIEDIEILKYDCLFGDTWECLDILKNNHDLFFLSSRSIPENLEAEMRWLGIDKFVKESYIVSPPQATEKKYDRLKNFDRRDAIFVGDTEMDYDAANKSGIPFVALNRGFRSRAYWDSIKVKSYSNLRSVEKIIVGLNTRR